MDNSRTNSTRLKITNKLLFKAKNRTFLGNDNPSMDHSVHFTVVQNVLPSKIQISQKFAFSTEEIDLSERNPVEIYFIGTRIDSN